MIARVAPAHHHLFPASLSALGLESHYANSRHLHKLDAKPFVEVI
jgi:hypothetical protein